MVKCMKFEMYYADKKSKVKQSITWFILNFIIDASIAVFVDIAVFIVYIFTSDEFADFLRLFSVKLSEWFIDTNFIPFVIAIQTIIIIAVEIKRRKVYVKITPRGVIIHNGNGQRFGTIQLYKPYAMIKYKHIISCYISTPYDMLPEVKYIPHLYIMSINRQNQIKNPYLIPAISYGRYDSPCVCIELDTNMVAVLPINECSEFIELFNKYFSIYKGTNK